MPKKTGSRYPEEFKAEAVQLARSSPEKSIRQLAYELGIADQTLRNWIKQAEIDRGEREGLSTEEREELHRLRRENRILREEREILRHSGAFFEKEDGLRSGPSASPRRRRRAIQSRYYAARSVSLAPARTLGGAAHPRKGLDTMRCCRRKSR